LCNLTLARDVAVVLKSRTMEDPTKPFTITATATHSAGSPGEPQTYNYAIPNLTTDKATQKAKSLVQELTAHEIKLSAALPADNTLDITNIIKVTGTNSEFDQLYFPDEIVRRMSLDEGYTMQVSAKSDISALPIQTQVTT